MQPFRRSRQPRPKAVLCPVSRSEQNNASALHEQRAQIAIAALADAAEDRPIARRYLLRYQTEPSRQSHDPWQTRCHCQWLLPLRWRMIGPMPGTVINCRQPSVPCASSSISSVTCSIRSSRRRQSSLRSSIILMMRDDSTSVRLAKMSGSCCRRKRSPWRTGIPCSKRKPRI